MLNHEHDACNEMLAPYKGSPQGLNPREKRVGAGEAPLRCTTEGQGVPSTPWLSSVMLAHPPGHWGGWAGREAEGAHRGLTGSWCADSSGYCCLSTEWGFGAR